MGGGVPPYCDVTCGRIRLVHADVEPAHPRTAESDGTAAANYVDAFFENIDWEEVSRRLDAA